MSHTIRKFLGTLSLYRYNNLYNKTTVSQIYIFVHYLRNRLIIKKLSNKIKLFNELMFDKTAEVPLKVELQTEKLNSY